MAALITFSPYNINFGAVTESTSSSSVSMLLTSAGSDTAFINITPQDSRYTATPNGNFTLTPGQTLTVVFQFNANATAGASSTQFFSFQGQPIIVSSPTLSATTVAPGAPSWNITPSQVNFGTLKLGSTSSVMNVKVSNTGAVNLVINTITLGPSEFSLSGLPSLPVTITPGNNIVFQVTCTPTFQGLNDYPQGIVLTPSVGSPQYVELTYMGFVLTPAFTLTGATQGVMFGFLGQWNNIFTSYIAQSLISLACEAATSWAKMHDFNNPGANAYASKLFMRTEPSGAANTGLTVVGNVSQTTQSVPASGDQLGTLDSTGIPNWIQYDFEVNGEIINFLFSTTQSSDSELIMDLYQVQYEIRGPVYEST